MPPPPELQAWRCLQQPAVTLRARMLRLEVRRQDTARPNSFNLWSQGREGSCRPSTITARKDRITNINSRLQLKLVMSLSLNFLMRETEYEDKEHREDYT